MRRAGKLGWPEGGRKGRLYKTRWQGQALWLTEAGPVRL